MTNVVFRVDSSLQIGTGHVMRCLTLADELTNKGVSCRFICREHQGHLLELICEREYEAIGLPGDPEAATSSIEGDTEDAPLHHSWLGTDWLTDLEQTKNAIGSEVIDWLIVDHYALDARWEGAMRNVCANLMVIDDLADREHDCDLLLDQNYFRKGSARYNELVPTTCTQLVGPKYALVRNEFLKARGAIKPRDGKVNRVLVFFGGSDPDNVTGLALKALSCTVLAHLRVDVVIGSSNPHRHKLAAQIRNRSLTELHVQTEQMSRLLSCSDLVIGAGGITTWERFVLGLPSIIVTIAKNQEQFTQDLHDLSALTLVGSSLSVSSDQIRKAICLSIDEPERNREQGLIGLDLVNGHGVKLIAKLMLSGNQAIA